VAQRGKAPEARPSSAALDAALRAAPDPRPAETIRGIAVSEGLVIGRVRVIRDAVARVARKVVSKEQAKDEVTRFLHALKASVMELDALYKQAEKEMGKKAAEIFVFHRGMLSDKSLVEPIRKRIETENVCAEWAVQQAFTELAALYAKNTNSVFASKVNDIHDLSQRLLRHLMGTQPAKLTDLEEGTVIVARDLTPSQTAAFDRAKLAGFATDLGGKTSHTAIVARALGIPAVVGCQALLSRVSDGDLIILDADRGIAIVHPGPEHLEEYRGIIEQKRLYRLSLTDVAALPAVTQDGTAIELLGNIEFAEEVPAVLGMGGQGVGLYRTEFLYLARDTEPTEGDHYLAYKTCLEELTEDGQSRVLTIRTVDLGADKYTQSRAEVPERNPFLGCRSIRYCLQPKALPMFRKQLRAILRASGLRPGVIKVMFPLISSVGEFRQAKYLVNDAMEDLAEEGLAFDPDIRLGMMVEVPSAALMAETFAREVDFFSIGTNDLVQYTLAVDRTNERVANLYTPTHPAVIRLIRDVIRAARRHRTPVSCCGEAASEPDFALLLMGLGLRTLSVTASSIPHLKRLIRSVSIAQCERIARQALSFDSEAQIATFLRDRARKIVPEAFDGRTAE
jgi:phosphotransferase system enzyme I (PtsI)